MTAPTPTRRPPARTAGDELFIEQPARSPAVPQLAAEAATARPPASFAISVVFEGFPVTATFAGTAAQLPAAIAQLRQLGALPPSQKLEWSYTPEGLPICPRHGAPMKKRERQGDTWYSHVVVDGQGEECYCRGYAGKESPGWDC
jgi:hypothetical protein